MNIQRPQRLAFFILYLRLSGVDVARSSGRDTAFFTGDRPPTGHRIEHPSTFYEI